LLDEACPIEVFIVEHERESGHIGYGRLVVARRRRFELNPERGELRIDLAGLALT